jgi:hypothetical protein
VKKPSEAEAVSTAFLRSKKTVETVSSSALLHAPGSSPVLMQIAGLPVQSA